MSPMALYATALFCGAALPLWVAGAVWNSSHRPGRRLFIALMLAEAWWCVSSGLHALVEPLPQRILVAQWQYFGIVAVPPLWFLFAAAHARAAWASSPWAWGVAWVPALATLSLAWTNPWHGLLWRDVRAVDTGMGIVYDPGPWIVVSVIHVYGLLAAGTWMLARHEHGRARASKTQAFLIGGLGLPWALNAVYRLGLVPVPGLDLTPVGFALSAACLLWAIHRRHLLDLVPVSRLQVVERMPDAVLVLDGHDRIIDANAAAHQLPEVSGGALVGRAAAEVFGWWPQVRRPDSSAVARHTVLTLEDGARFLEVETAPVAAPSGRALVVTLRDVSSRERTEAEVTALRLRMREQQRLEGLAVLTAGLGGQIVDLLRGIEQDVRVLAAHEQQPRQRDILDGVVGATRRARDLADRVHAIGQPSDDARMAVDLDAIVEDVLALVQASNRGRRDIIYRRRSDGGLPVEGDAALLRQAVLHALSNACDAADEWDVVRVTTGVAPLTPADLKGALVGDEAPAGTYAYVEVADTGPGMSAATLVRAIDPTYSTRRLGAGLGLPSLISIVRAHRGVLTVLSVVGRGTIVRAAFPLQTA